MGEVVEWDGWQQKIWATTFVFISVKTIKLNWRLFCCNAMFKKKTLGKAIMNKKR